MKDFVEYLEKMIEGCDSLGGMEREKATYQSVLKQYRKQCNIAPVVGRSEQLKCMMKRNDGNCDCGIDSCIEGGW